MTPNKKNPLAGWRCVGLLLLVLTNHLLADSFGLFTYTDNGTSISITDYPTTETGPVVIPDTIVGKPVTSIGASAFLNCSNLTSITIPFSVTSIGNNAFQSCTGLTSISISANVTSIGSGALSGCASLTNIAVDPQNLNYSSVDGILLNKNQTRLIQCPSGKVGSITILPGVTSIDTTAFSFCSKLTTITIPDSVTSIGISAFWECAGLTDVTISSNLISIGPSAFSGCSSLTSIAIPASVTSIGNDAFSSCTSLTGITVSPQNLNYSSVDGILFNKNQSTLLKCPGGKTGSAVIPSSIKTIDPYVFEYCSSLTSVTIPTSVTSIGTRAFYGCSSLTSISIPASVTSIGASAFSNCNSLTIITISASITTIGSSAFSYCTSLTGITVSPQNLNYSSVDGILFNKSQTALIQCPSGKTGSLVIPPSVTSIGVTAFASCSSLTSVTIPTSVTSIGSGAFSNCNGLKSITIPASITSIGGSAFSNCNILTSITIPASVTSIGSSAFTSCDNLESAIFIGNAPTVTSGTLRTGSFSFVGSDFAVYYFSGKMGFTSPTWQGYPSVNMGEPSFSSPWLVSNGFPHDTDMMADPNGDGVSLLMAYALALDPRQNLNGSIPRPVIVGDQMSLIFYAGSEGITYKVETSANLQSWSEEGVTISPLDANGLRTAWFSGGGPSRFMRLAVSR